MEELGRQLASLHGLSFGLGAVLGLALGFVALVLMRRQLRDTFEQASVEQAKRLEQSQAQLKSAFESLAAQALQNNQSSFLELAGVQFSAQSQRYSSELEGKKSLIDSQLSQMSDTLKTVPSELEKNQRQVSEVIDKSTQSLAESNQAHLSQLQQRADAQTKEHVTKLDEKELQINRRLGEMDAKLGRVQELIGEFEKARESKLGALDEQLKSLTTTTATLQMALADNRARGQWGERMAEDMLQFMGLVEGVNYTKQGTIAAGTRPDFTFRLPNEKSLHMDAKFPLDNYLRYIEAQTEAERNSYSKKFLSDVNQRVTEIKKRDYIAADTLDCVLIFIPNEQVYRFIHEQDHSVIDSALQQKVILCSPLTLYIVLSVIRQAAQNFNIERRSREIIDIVNEIRGEWDKYTGQMDKLERRFKGMHDDFHALTATRTRQLDRKFVKVDNITKNKELDGLGNAGRGSRPSMLAGG